jgi:HD-like signal output (HDOD) protein
MSVTDANQSQRVLFVDDEPRVLRGLFRLLRDDRWVLESAESGLEALEKLARAPFDVIVSDYRMPGMDGVTLLEHVRDAHPETVRIVLSGDIDQSSVLRSTAVAHQCLSKPCQPEFIVAALERAQRLRAMLAQEGLRRMIGRLGSLPSSPTLWAELERRLSDPDASAADLAAIISGDVAMTTKVLQLVNSAFMGLSRTVTSVAEAVAYLGVEMIRNLVVSVEIFRSFPLADNLALFSIDALSRHGQACSQLVMRQVRQPQARDHAAAAALLQDVGQLVHANCDPDTFDALLRTSVEEHRPLHEVEHEAHGFTHADIGAYLLTLWGLPAEVVDAVSRHHHPLPPHAAVDPGITGTVRAAHVLVQAARPSAADPTDAVSPQRAEAELVAGLEASVLDRWSAQATSDEEETMGIAGAAL